MDVLMAHPLCINFGKQKLQGLWSWNHLLVRGMGSECSLGVWGNKVKCGEMSPVLSYSVIEKNFIQFLLVY